MEYDWFWNLFFHPLYVNYSSLHKVETELSLAVVPYKNPVKFKGIQEINPEITRYHSVQIQFKSFKIKAAEYFIPKNSGMKTDDFFMKVHVFFDLDVFHLFPMHIRAYFEVYTKDSEGKETPVRRIEFTQYQQNTEKNKTAPAEKRSPFLVYDEDEDEDEEIYKTYDGVNYTRQQWIDFENAQYKIYMEKKKKKGFWDFFG
ncbi:hypothetical protein VUJ46_00990 [Chryseobacterium sp. MYb264]|uniref:hypothetical protein n=1 Tax=Chryseobacterium sp. MYb264 TaxID=2745153 RepID=UPI002E149B7E|nr:hypothetical protein VUJ46_00990 [Chryseobacterium sp. MYb264]